MKKALSMIVSALVAVSFAGVVLAAEPAPLPAGHPPIKAEEKKVVKKAKKAKTAKKAAVKKEEVKPAAAPAAAPAAK